MCIFWSCRALKLCPNCSHFLFGGKRNATVSGCPFFSLSHYVHCFSFSPFTLYIVRQRECSQMRRTPTQVSFFLFGLPKSYCLLLQKGKPKERKGKRRRKNRHCSDRNKLGGARRSSLQPSVRRNLFYYIFYFFPDISNNHEQKQEKDVELKTRKSVRNTEKTRLKGEMERKKKL